MASGTEKVKNTAEKGREAIEISDQVIRDLKIPIMTTVLELQDQIFKIADDLHIGAAVRTLVYGIRTAEYVGVLASGLVPATAVGAGAGVVAAGVSIGTLGVAALVVGIVFLLFGGDDDAEERQKARAKEAQATIRHFVDRLSLEGFTNEQKHRALLEKALAMLPSWAHAGDAQQHWKLSGEASLLAEFYRRADKELEPFKHKVFESLSNIGRWESLLGQFQKMSHEERSTVTGIGFGTSKPTDYLATLLKAKLVAERKNFYAMAPEALAKFTVAPWMFKNKASSQDKFYVLALASFAAYKLWRVFKI